MEHDKANVSSLKALQIWKGIPQTTRDMLTQNVWCSHCKDAVRIVEYSIMDDKYGLVLNGACGRCGNMVARVVEKD
jgi:hypothetical protein